MAFAVPASPVPFIDTQADGTSVLLQARGDEHFSWLEDTGGYTVIRKQGWLHYAELDAHGQLQASPWMTGFDDPEALGLTKGLLPASSVRSKNTRSLHAGPGRTNMNNEQSITSGTLENLVVMIRFSNHNSRSLPPVSAYNTLFNAEQKHSSIAPTGSLKGVYREMSYGQLNINSTLSGWITVSNTEAYYANNAGGDETLWEALVESLEEVDKNTNFADFDKNNDGYVDSIAFIHSGYGAEWTGNTQRIWSTQWGIYVPYGGWVSGDKNANGENVKVRNYHISTGLWSTAGSSIARIGVLAHETGHFLGLPDLYDTDYSAGDGVGHWGLMGDPWGFDGQQRCASHMTPWSKQELGWIQPTPISEPGPYAIAQVETHAEAYRIDTGYPAGEYLLVENRQKVGLDCSIPQGGLLVWHIDENAGFETEGFPGQSGWPGNSKHYRVALLQADGQFHLERGQGGGGGAGDVHHSGGVDAIVPGPGGHPNTDAYQAGNVAATGVAITHISAASANMSFCLDYCSEFDGPTNLLATASGTDSIRLSWDDNARTETGFLLEHSLDGVNWNFEANLSADTEQYTDSGLPPGSTYRYRVLAVREGKPSAWSNTALATTSRIPPSWKDYYSISQQQLIYRLRSAGGDTAFTPKLRNTRLRDTNRQMGSRTEFLWKFQINAGDESIVHLAAGLDLQETVTEYEFEWSADRISYQALFIVDAGTAGNELTGLIPAGVSGEIWIRAVSAQRVASHKQRPARLLVDQLYIRVGDHGQYAIPVTPTGLTASVAGKTSIELNWSDNALNESGYAIYRSSNSGSIWTRVALRARNSRSWTDMGLKPDWTYQYRIFAYNADGNSRDSAVATATTDDADAAEVVLHSALISKKHLTLVELNWRGSDARAMDLYRNGVLLDTVHNDGFYRYPLDLPQHASVMHTVCDAGTENCSSASRIRN